MGYKDRVFPHILPTLTHLLGVQLVPGPQGSGLFLYSTTCLGCGRGARSTKAMGYTNQDSLLVLTHQLGVQVVPGPQGDGFKKIGSLQYCILTTLTHLLGVQVVPGPQGDRLQGSGLTTYSILLVLTHLLGVQVVPGPHGLLVTRIRHLHNPQKL